MRQTINRTVPALAESSSPVTPDYGAIKEKQQSTWASGDYGQIGVRLQIVGETLAEAVDLRAGERVIDVAAGNGNASLAAARRFADVTSTDYIPELLDNGKERARGEGLSIQFEAADAEDLPYPDGSFDVALSTFGVMFAPQHKKSASELLRVVRSGGRIGLANWTPEGFIGDLFRLIGCYVPPPAGLQAPTLWGSEPHIVELFGANASDIRCERRIYNFRFESTTHWIKTFRNYYGPIHKAFGMLDADQRAQLTADLTALLEWHNVGGPNSLVAPGEYLEIVVTKK